MTIHIHVCVRVRVCMRACATSSNTTVTCHWLLQNVIGFESCFNSIPRMEVNVQSCYRLMAYMER
jgi:hypothetical protein